MTFSLNAAYTEFTKKRTFILAIFLGLHDLLQRLDEIPSQIGTNSNVDFILAN